MILGIDAGYIFLFQLGCSLVTYSLLWAWYVAPHLLGRSVHEPLTWLIVPLLFQFVEITPAVASVVREVAPRFASVGFINLITVPLAMLSLAALRRYSPIALPLIWILSLQGIACGIATAYFGVVENVPDKLGPHWYIGVLYLPLQIFCHIKILLLIAKHGAQLRGRPFFIKAA